MSISNFPSKLLENTVDEFSRLPGIGKKSALRLVLHLLRQPTDDVNRFAQSIISLKRDIKYCRECNSLSDTDICSICSSPKRNSSILMSIEATSQYNGLYYVLGGLISPMDGVGPADLNIEGLLNKISAGTVKEVIMALSATMEGDTTNFYIYKKLKPFDVDVTAIARGVAFGDDLEYADEITLGRAIVNRVKFESTVAN